MTGLWWFKVVSWCFQAVSGGFKSFLVTVSTVKVLLKPFARLFCKIAALKLSQNSQTITDINST